MKITYKEMNEDLDYITESQKRDPLEKYSIDIDGELKVPSALKVLEVIESQNTFAQRAQFVKELLLGCKVTVYKNEKKEFDVGITQGVEWWAIDGFNADPMALRYLVTSVYAKFLKKYVA